MGMADKEISRRQNPLYMKKVEQELKARGLDEIRDGKDQEILKDTMVTYSYVQEFLEESEPPNMWALGFMSMRYQSILIEQNYMIIRMLSELREGMDRNNEKAPPTDEDAPAENKDRSGEPSSDDKGQVIGVLRRMEQKLNQ